MPHLFKHFIKTERGSTTFVFATLFILVLTIGIFTMDYTRVIYYRSMTQQALDNAIIAAVSKKSGDPSISLQDMSLEANKIFIVNTAGISSALTYSNFQLLDIGGGTYTGSVDMRVNTLFSGAISNNNFIGAVNLTATAQYIDYATEVAIAVETSRLMSSKTSDVQTILRAISDGLYGDGSTPRSNLFVSLIPYSNGVKPSIPKNTLNQWHSQPYREVNEFRGCMSIRQALSANGSTSNTLPNGTTNLYINYLGALGHRFDNSINPTLEHVDADGNVTYPLMQYGFSRSGYAAYLGVANNWLGVDGGRDDHTIDYIYRSSGTSASEKVSLDWKTPYDDGYFFIDLRSFLSIHSSTDPVRNERGVWRLYAEDGTLLDSDIFTSVDTGINSNIHRVELPIIPGATKLEIEALDNGNRSIMVSGTSGYPAQLDNSDFAIDRLFYIPGCAIAETSLFLTDKTSFDNASSNLPLDGRPLHIVGIEWMWNTLSSNWQGIYPDNTALPRENVSADKVGVIIAGSDSDVGPFWNNSARNICNGIHAYDSDIEIYVITVGASNSTENELRHCATDNSNIFNDPTASEIEAAFAQLLNNAGNNSNPPRLRLVK